MKRSAALGRIRSASEPFDVAIVGGGATGLGAAVDAASRGLRVVLLERHDFAKGTSSRSTKLVHGGVRYLRQGNIPLVLEALRERGRLMLNAPHLVHDLAFVIPAYRWWEGPFYGAGMKLYDLLAGRRGVEASRRLSRESTLKLLPTLEPARLREGVVYHDGQFDDARLAIALARTADNFGAALVNYCPCVGLIKHGGRVRGVLARDFETGEELPIAARTVINASGVFVDELRRLDRPDAPTLTSTSQGIHLVLPRSFLPGSAALMVPKTADGRVLFAVPWHDRLVVGTTDTPLSAHTAEPRALEAECDFVLSHARKYLAKDPSEGDVLSVFAGLRPLVKRGASRRTASLSRGHSIIVDPSGLITITGGKWTTYRQMAEEVINRAQKVGDLPALPCRTASLPLHGWTRDDHPAPHLRPYGSDAAALSELMGTPALAQKLHPALPYLQGEVLWHARAEMARTVEDVLARRTRALLLDARASIEAAPVVARLLATELGRTEAWQAAQISEYTALARGYVFTDPASRGTA